MRKAFSVQGRFDVQAVTEIELDLECRDEMIPVLAALQHIYSQPVLRDEILALGAADVNRDTSTGHGREGLDYWQILVLAAVRLGCNFNYDRLQDLARNHRALRHMMGLGDWDWDRDDQPQMTWRRIRDNVCLLSAETIERISHLIVGEGHRLVPEAARTTRADSFVMETDIHYPTDSSLIRDGLRKILELCMKISEQTGATGWRQHAHLLKKVRQSARQIDRIAARKGKNSQQRMKAEYQKLLKLSHKITGRARELCEELSTGNNIAVIALLTELETFLDRTEQVMDTATRRVIHGESVPNQDKLFSIFEPHTQLYKRGKAGEPVQFGRLVMVYEDGAGFITHHHLLERDEADRDVVVEQTRIVQQRLNGRIERASFDRGFHSPENQIELAKIVAHPCLPKPGAKQAAAQDRQASVEFRQARQNHPGVESTIGALQSGNGLKRSRDRTELGFERYLALGILGRNLHVLGKLAIARKNELAEAAASRRRSPAAA